MNTEATEKQIFYSDEILAGKVEENSLNRARWEFDLNKKRYTQASPESFILRLNEGEKRI